MVAAAAGVGVAAAVAGAAGALAAAAPAAGAGVDAALDAGVEAAGDAAPDAGVEADEAVDDAAGEAAPAAPGVAAAAPVAAGAGVEEVAGLAWPRGIIIIQCEQGGRCRCEGTRCSRAGKKVEHEKGKRSSSGWRMVRPCSGMLPSLSTLNLREAQKNGSRKRREKERRGETYQLRAAQRLPPKSFRSAA